MAIEVRFTLLDTNEEIPFSVVEGENNQLFLYSNFGNANVSFGLESDNGLLRLTDNNPFAESEDIVYERLTGISADWLEVRAQGFEETSDFEEVVQPGYGPDDIFVENKPFSLRQIVDLIRSDDIELTPDFQRNFIWDRTRQSKLIESILLGLPLPSIYLSQYEDGRLTVVDGLQRLHTIKAFMDNELVLTNLEYLKNCNGKKFSQLDAILSPLRIRRFGQTQIMCFVIDYRSPSKLKFDLFRRLNTGGKPLNNQEIRNCLSKPEVQYLLKRMVNLESFGRATGWSVKDTRMEAREAALRFIYFFEQYDPANPVGRYKGDMESTLDDFIDELNRRSIDSMEEYIQIYDRALDICHRFFEDYCFRKVTPDTLGRRRAPVNKLMMLCLSVLISRYSSSIVQLEARPDIVYDLATFIESRPHLFEAITYSTNAKRNIEMGFVAFKDFFDALLHE